MEAGEVLQGLFGTFWVTSRCFFCHKQLRISAESVEPNFKITSSLGCFVFTPFRSIMCVSYFTRKNLINLPKQKEMSATAAPLYTTVGCCCVSVRVHYQPPACAFYGIFKSASHLNALDSIRDEISPVCSGQSLKGPLKTRMPSHPQCGLNNKNKEGGGGGYMQVSQIMWMKTQIGSFLNH